jgi:DNA-binding response OmpR family regulator
VAILLALARTSEREFISSAFEQLGHVVECCSEAQLIIDRALSQYSDVVVAEAALARDHIKSVCRELGSSAQIGVVLLVDGLDSLARADLLELGADDVVQRPFDVRELLARVEAVLRRVARSTRNLRAGRITVMERERTAYVDDARVDLTAREWTLLRYLVRRADHTVTRAEVLANVWSSSQNPGSNVLDVHVARLRQKLGDAGRSLRCVRGVGYRLEGEAPGTPDNAS